MKKIIVHGMAKYYATCHKCNCEFEYELSDIDDDFKVTCPDCGCKVSHFVYNYICGSQIEDNNKEQ